MRLRGLGTGSGTTAQCVALLGTPIAGFFPSCQGVYDKAAADAYEYMQYGGNVASIPIYKPSATDTPQKIAAAQQAIISQAMAEGYHPQESNFLSATEIGQTVDNAVSGAKAIAEFDWMPYLIIGGTAIGLLLLSRR